MMRVFKPGTGLIGALAALAACGAAAEAADAVYRGGAIWTGAAPEDGAGAARAEAIAIEDGRIIFVGSDADAAAHIDADTRVVDVGGGFVVPGFIDNHTHFLSGGFALLSVDLRDAASPEEFTQRIADYAADLPEGRWILAGNWDHERWGGELPTRDWIDAATPANPVLVTRLDGHMSLANSLALTLADVDAETESPPGGEIVRDKNGAPTGVLKDAAVDLVARVIPPPSEEELTAAFAAAQAEALSHGVTQAHDMGDITHITDSLGVYKRMKARGEQKLRLYAFAPIADWEKLQAAVEANGRGDDLLRWGGLKGFVDGSLGSTTAWFYEPYADAPETSGLTVSDLDTLAADIAGASAAGLHVAVHAIGDRANDWLLDQFEKAGGDDIAAKRFRIEHAQHLSKAAIDRFGALGVIASMQPYHAIDDGRWAEKRIGPDRIKRTYAFRSLLDAGARLTFGSDWPVAPLDPVAGVYAAATRRTIDGANPKGWVPAQKISVEEALTAYTAANAYAGFQEDDLGTLEPGKLADFVVLSADLTAIEPAAIKDVKVLRTVIGGEDVYTAP